jgi:hypothetical protein
VSDGDESPRRPSTKRRTPRVRAESSSPGEDEELAENNDRALDKKTRWIHRRIEEKQLDEDSESEEDIQPKKRKFIKGVRPSSPKEYEDDILDEVDEDCESLLHSLVRPGNVTLMLRYH